MKVAETEVRIPMRLHEDLKTRFMEAGDAYAKRLFKERGGTSEWVMTVLAKAIQDERKVDLTRFPILDAPRAESFEFRCSKLFRATCKKAAGKAGMTVSTWIQAQLLTELEMAKRSR